MAPLLVFSFLLLAWLVRSWALQRATRDSVHLLREVTALIPREDEASADWFPLFPGTGSKYGILPADPTQRQAEASLAQPGEATAQPNPNDKREGALPSPEVRRQQSTHPRSVTVSREQVLRWAEQRVVPVGRSVPEDRGMPAGIELSGVVGLGIGLRDGDRLVSVAGAPVTDRSRVVTEVLAARGRGAESIVAGLVRATADGPQFFSVTILQPYLDAP